MRKLMWFTVGFALASLASSLIYGSWILLGCALTLLIMIPLLVFREKIRMFKSVVLVFLGIAGGFLWFFVYDSLFVLLPRVADGQTLTVTIEATDYAYKTDYGSAVEGKVNLNGDDYRVKAYLHVEENVEPGNLLTGQFRFRLTAAGGKEDPTSHQSEGIFLLAYPVGNTAVDPHTERSFEHYPAIWRRQILNRIDEVFSGKARIFAAALLLGERSEVTYEMDTSFKVSGISHIIAVSGLHVSILFGLVHTFLARRRVLTFFVGLPVLFLFAAVAGFTPSITRACIMQGLFLLAMVLDREYDPPTALSFAVLTMLVFNPLTVLSVSFQLSVGCMMGIFLFSEKIRLWMVSPFEKRLKRRKMLSKVVHTIAASASVSLSASVITTPLVACYFGCVSLVSVFTNILVIWVISYIFYGIILCLLTSLASIFVAKFLALPMTALIYFVLYTAEFMAKLPMAAVYTSSIYTVVWLCGAYVLLTVFLLQRKKRPILFLTCIVCTLLLSQSLAWLEPMLDDVRITMLDVGQGQCILLQSDGKTFLVDCGGDDDETAADVAAEALLNQGISRLDGLIVTHTDRDHAGGVAYLLTRIRTDRLILPYVEDEEGTLQSLVNATDGVVDYVQKDLVYSFGSTKMTIFSPITYYSGNESSICILFQTEKCGILITGDRGELGESVLLKEHEIPQVDILVVGHHGSAGSTTDALLKATNPQVALISVGEDNRYGHPSQKVLNKLIEAGCIIYRTDMDGTIVFRR